MPDKYKQKERLMPDSNARSCGSRRWGAKLLSGVLLTAVLAVGCSQSAEAFCIYNKTNGAIAVTQMSNYKHKWSSFSALIGHRNKACCNWKNKDCNRAGKRDSEIKFNIISRVGDLMRMVNCEEVFAKAGGWVEVVDYKPGLAICRAYYAP